MTKQLKMSAFVLAMALSANAMAYDRSQEVPGYAQSEKSGAIVRNNYNECWQTGSWTPELKAGCDGKVTPDQPAPVIDTPVIRETKERLSADVLFAFDSAKLTPVGKQKLDEVIAKIQGLNVTDIAIAGHTDFKGSDAYNQRLSERRAASVKNYLAKSINPAVMQAVGYGESQQRMKDVCEQQTAGIRNAAKRRLALIECIKEDRHVSVDIHYVDQK